MNTDYDQESEERPRKAKPAGKPKQKKPVDKQSYESNIEVQRWLQDQALDEIGTKAAFTPTLLIGRRDRDWILSSLTHFYEQDLITDVVHVAQSGKEATVFCCTATASGGLDYLAAKVYRPRMFRSLKNDAVYRENRQQRDERGKVVRGSRRWRGDGKPTERGRAERVSSWIAYEFATQRLVYDAGADVPQPIDQIGNAVLMAYIGDADEPAPRLSDVTLAHAEAQPLFDSVMRNIALFLACDRIHGDLSSYNILYWQGTVSIIDFAQAVDARQSEDVFALLERDVERVCHYFAAYGVAADASALALELWTRYLCGEL
jgi:RIO kinase 1